MASGDRFWFWKLCLDVTHPRPLSRGEVWDAVFLLVMRGLLCLNSPLERGLRGAGWVEVLQENGGIRAGAAGNNVYIGNKTWEKP